MKGILLFIGIAYLNYESYSFLHNSLLKVIEEKKDFQWWALVLFLVVLVIDIFIIYKYYQYKQLRR